jgi:hypothetical protein
VLRFDRSRLDIFLTFISTATIMTMNNVPKTEATTVNILITLSQISLQK